MSNVTQPRLHHLAITVTDLDASVRWYESVFDVHPVLDVPHPGGVGRILAGTDRQLMIALHRHDDQRRPSLRRDHDRAGPRRLRRAIAPRSGTLAGAPRSQRRRTRRHSRQATDPVTDS